MLKLVFAGALSLGYYTGIGLPRAPYSVSEVKESYVQTAEYVRTAAGEDNRLGKALLFGIVGAAAGGGAGCCFDLLTGCLPFGTCGGACAGGLVGGLVGYSF